jgi:calcineurin-like phosphoesterase family protein
MGICSVEVLQKVMDKLHGTKVLILGNHDRGVNAMYRMGFDLVLYNATLYIGAERVTMSHCPLRGVWREDTSNMRGCDGTENWHKEHKHTKFSVENEGQFHLHGHIHSRPGKDVCKKIEGKQFDVGAPGNNYRVYSFGQIESWINKYKRSLDATV